MGVGLFWIAGLMYMYGQAIEKLYVAPNGNDMNPGTEQAPLKTIERAKELLRTAKKGMSRDITVYLRGGIYPVTQPIIFTEMDSGINGFTIRYTAYPGEKPVLNGAIPVKGWKKQKGDIYKVPLDRTDKLRQLYVNGERRYMSRGEGIGHEDGFRWGEFIITGNENWADGTGLQPSGVIFKDKKNLPVVKSPEWVELHSQSGFAYHITCLQDIISIDSGRVALLQQPMGAIATNTPEQWGCGFFKNILGPQRLYHFENAMELLDEPGEFYFDGKNKTLYYYKKANENMAEAEVYAPVSEGFLSITGASVSNRVRNLEFSNLCFEYDHWALLRVENSYGMTAVQSIPLQSRFCPDGMMHNAKYSYLQNQRASIRMENAENITFSGNTLQHIGSLAMDLTNDVVDCYVTENSFRDIGSGAFNIGDARNLYIGDGDIPVEKEGIVTGIRFTDNSITDCGREYMAAPAVSVIWGRNIEIAHNLIRNNAYSGISVGWGWTNYSWGNGMPVSTVTKDVKVNFNIVENVCNAMHDGSSIYTLGLLPGSEINGNYLIGGGGSGIYLDQGSAYLTVKENVCVKKKENWFFIWGIDAKVRNITILDNYADHLNGNEIENAWYSIEKGTTSVWSEVTEHIVKRAGVRNKK
jgi:hypothetical protein